MLKRAGLTPWQVGEIASRIGQIYYEYYTRTGEARFLREGAVWYDTIRKRQYFRPADPTTTELLQQLRYYMRFTLICILLNDLSKVRRQADLPGAPRTRLLIVHSSARVTCSVSTRGRALRLAANAVSFPFNLSLTCSARCRRSSSSQRFKRC